MKSGDAHLLRHTSQAADETASRHEDEEEGQVRKAQVASTEEEKTKRGSALTSPILHLRSRGRNNTVEKTDRFAVYLQKAEGMWATPARCLGLV